jgi:hypothetical protein
MSGTDTNLTGKLTNQASRIACGLPVITCRNPEIESFELHGLTAFSEVG